jgi:molecular chaperone GrpE
MEEAEKNMEENDSRGTDNSIPVERVERSESKTEKEIPAVENNSSALKAANEKISALENQVAELRDMLLRKVADFENYKRRNENDQLNLLKYAAEPFIRNILPVFDDLERSLTHIDDAGNFESTKKGLQLVFEKFAKVLDGQGIKRIEAKGKPFDVENHEALMQQPAEGVEPHTVLEVLEPGYLYKDKVIRHAKVIVSAETASREDPNPPQSTGSSKDENNK